MIYLTMNSDDTFELRWVDYFSNRYHTFLTFSGFDEIMNLEEGT